MTTVVDRSRPENSGARVSRQRPEPVVVNGVVIPRDAIARETQHHPASKPHEAWLAAARALVVRELLIQEARRLAIVAVPNSDEQGRRETDDEALVRQLIEHEVAVPEPDVTSCRRIYDQKQTAFRSSDLYAVRHILLAASPGEPEARAEARRQADAIIATVTAAPGSFGELANACSACPSNANGGALGQISRGQTVPEFEAALKVAPVGVVYETPVESRYGFHVIFLDQRLEGRPLPFELVHERIAAWLVDRSQQIAIRQYISLLAGRAKIAGIEIEASTSALVQ